MENMKQTMNELNTNCKHMGGNLNKTWNNLHKNINSRLSKKTMEKKDFQNFNNMIQQMLKELK